MTAEQKTKTKFTRTATFKGMMIAVLSLVLLIPSFMVQSLIYERQRTRDEAVGKIDAKWSYAQTISGPILTIPYTQTKQDAYGKPATTEHTLNIIPDNLNIHTELYPEERYYGIYKTILYKSVITVTGEFSPVVMKQSPGREYQNNKAYIRLGVSDLRGICEEITFELNGETYDVVAGNKGDNLTNATLVVNSNDINLDETLGFSCEIELKGSSSINFLPIGRTTYVSVEGAWPDPGFIGNYTPEYALDENGFRAEWKVLHFNRSIPDQWTDNNVVNGRDISFGVNLVDPVDIYQLNMRSAKYALMFIVLTFVVFFFVEVVSRKRIHPVQYLLVGVALILFYSLLLSISEPLGFGWAYLISSVATIGLITGYSVTIFKNKKQTVMLTGILATLYGFLYVILKLENTALLAGSIGLFIILGIIMLVSQRIKWYSEEE